MISGLTLAATGALRSGKTHGMGPPAVHAQSMAAALIAGMIGHRVDPDTDWLPQASFRHQARDVRPDELLSIIGTRRGIQRPVDVAILIHGLFIDEQNYLLGPSPLADYLEPLFGWTPLLVRYNSGRHISESGEAIADLIQELHQQWGSRLGRIQLVGHSMGGLVARATLATLERRNAQVLNHVERLFLLGAPNHGAELERLGHFVDLSLNRILHAPAWAWSLFGGKKDKPRHSVTGAVVGAVDNAVLRSLQALAGTAGLPLRLVREVVDLRSPGIRDVRYGYMQESEWRMDEQMAGRFGINHRRPLPPPPGVRTYAVAGSLLPTAGREPSRLRSDGMVSVASAVGFGGEFDDLKVVPKGHFVEVPLLAHQLVPSSERVRAHLRAWVDGEPRRS